MSISHRLFHWLHCLTHKHLTMSKPGVGMLECCTLRRPRARPEWWFMPAHERAAYPVHGTHDDIRYVAASDNSYEAQRRVAQLALDHHDGA